MAEDEGRKKRLFRILLVFPYFIGILWTCLHPIASILTGELKCRGWFLDENAIEIRFSNQRPEGREISLPGKSTKLCDALPTNLTNLVCYTHGDSFELMMIQPKSGAIDPTDEAVVLVVPSPNRSDWSRSNFHSNLAKSMIGLADPSATPWLAKTLFLVSPIIDAPLEDTVSQFLDAYLGSKVVGSGTAPIPPKLSKAILRNLVVIEVEDKSVVSRARRNSNDKGKTDISVLPQGKRGTLPNMDLVTLVGMLFQKASFLSPQNYPQSTFLAHGYREQSNKAKTFLSSIAPQESSSSPKGKIKAWAKDMSNLALFAYTMAAGPYPPHWPALDRGIDSVSIQAKFQGSYWRDPTVETIQILENVIHALSNLHERLHHSFVLYLLPSPDKFVSHMEYFLPTVLVLLPLAVRAFGMIAIGDIELLHLTTIGTSVMITLISMALMLVSSVAVPNNNTQTHTWMLLVYSAALFVWKKRQSSSSLLEGEKQLKNLQFAACATAAYVFVPIAFAHAALVYVPALVLIPLLAFPGYPMTKGSMAKMLLIGLWILAAPPVLLVPRFFDSYTTFVRYGYIPLHVQLMLLLLG
eukprot:scaffold5682_cov140-Cylindrotheca_fusiformis.AAC.5